MNKKKRIISLLMAVTMLLMTLFVGCGSKPDEDTSKSDSESKTITVTDMAGREVKIDGTAEKAVAIGAGSLRLYCYVASPDKLVGIEQLEKKSALGRPYMMANQQLNELPVIGQGGPNNAPDVEKILAVKPDVIFTTYADSKDSVDKLQEKTGIPVVALDYGKVSTFDPNLYSSIKIIGEVMGEEKRANEVVDYMEECKEDLANRTKDISDDKKPSAYAGALAYRGDHGIESTQGNYSLFNAVNAKNVADETGKTGSIMIDPEKLLEWDPDIIFLDYTGIKLVKEDYDKNPKFYKGLKAFKNGDVYSLLPYNWYWTNVDTAMIDAYYIGKVLYPEQFKDVDPEKKADEIYKFLLGKEIYSEMVEGYGKLDKITLE